MVYIYYYPVEYFTLIHKILYTTGVIYIRDIPHEFNFSKLYNYHNRIVKETIASCADKQ